MGKPLQKIQVQGKADGPRLASHALHELVVLTARQNALADAVQEAAEDHTAVVGHIVDDGEIEPHAVGVRSLFQVIPQTRQLSVGDSHRLVAAAEGG